MWASFARPSFLPSLSPPLLIDTLPPRRGCCTGAATVLAEQGPHQLDTTAICDVQQLLSTPKLRVSSSLDAARVSLAVSLPVSLCPDRLSQNISDKKHGRAVASEYGSTAAAASSRPAPLSPSRHEPEIRKHAFRHGSYTREEHIIVGDLQTPRRWTGEHLQAREKMMHSEKQRHPFSSAKFWASQTRTRYPSVVERTSPA